MDEKVAEELEEVKKEKMRIQKKIYDFNTAFPDIEKWLNDYHKECTEYVKKTEKTINGLVSQTNCFCYLTSFRLILYPGQWQKQPVFYMHESQVSFLRTIYSTVSV